MKDKQAAQTSSIVYAHLGYARILMQQNKQLEAILLLKQGIAISYARVNAIHRNELYENLSTCYEQLHQYHDALKYYKIFRLENDSLFNKDKERDLSEMRFKYDSERQENLIKQSKLDVMQKEQRIQQQTFILIIIVIVLGLLYYLYHRKKQTLFKYSQAKSRSNQKRNGTESPYKRIGNQCPLHGFYFRKICFLLTHRREKFRTFPYIRAYYERRKNLQRQFYNKRQSSRNIRN